MDKTANGKSIVITPCYDHLGGLLGESILKFFLNEGLIEKKDDDIIITEKGWDELEIIGIDIEKLHSLKRKMVNICVESKQGILYEHIGSYLGSLLMEKMIELGWLIKIDDKSLELTKKGLVGLESMGIKIKTLSSK